MSKQIKIRVYPDGRIESETVGIKGKQCLGYIKDIEAMTGAKIIKSGFTKDYYDTDQQVHLQNKGFQQNENKD